jgi:hypothetical protein
VSYANDSEAELRNQFTVATCQKLGDLVSLPPNELDPPIDDPFYMGLYSDDETMMFQIPEADLVDASGKPIIMQLLTDGLINTEVLLPIGVGEAIAKVVQCAVYSEGKLIGEYNENHILNTLRYMCKFLDGTVKKIAANMIASNIFEESDADGHRNTLLYKIVDHKSLGEAVKMADKYIVSRNGMKRIHQMTVGWKFLVKWTNGGCQWIPLKILKESNPVQVAKYVVA